jgi:hypothetical protein
LFSHLLSVHPHRIIHLATPARHCQLYDCCPAALSLPCCSVTACHCPAAAAGGADLDAELDLLQGLGWGELLEAEVGAKDREGGSLWLGGMQFAMADAEGGLATRGVLPKGTKRK